MNEYDGYVIATNKKFVAKAGSVKMKRKVTVEELKRRKFFAEHDFHSETDCNGNMIIVTTKKV